ncbi:MAG: L-serine ammonia-lyase, iron-sulfur-dependent, subunit alpha [Planctomycetes bacterium]|nr:L-serine ammonia-lyase, iron-sulfur-dependent, subunit alpha [Planctomycetota bacterium]
MRFRVRLYGSLAATGRGHLTDVAILEAIAPKECQFEWAATEFLPMHPNGMEFEAYDEDNNLREQWRVYSIGGGALQTEAKDFPVEQVYPLNTMAEILEWATREGRPLWAYVEECEGKEIWDFLREVWHAMYEATERGLRAAGALPGILKLQRKSRRHYEQALGRPGNLQRTGLLTAFALAVSEENAFGGVIVTAPTCGACGVLPGTLRFLQEDMKVDEKVILRALATAGLVGALVKTNASISGAAVGCQGEVGTACAMAAAAAAQVMGGNVNQVEYAAEMGFEHHLGLTCDPVAGLVQIPCIERNAVGATRAIACAEYSLLSDGTHEIPFDSVVETMRLTGEDLQHHYRETSLGGLAKAYTQRMQPNQCS